MPGPTIRRHGLTAEDAKCAADTARDNVIAAIDGADAIRAWRHVLGFVIANAVDPAGRIALKRKSRGAGW